MNVFVENDSIHYQWDGWLGCQLKSTEWRKPEVGEVRIFRFDFDKVIELTIWRVYSRGWFKPYECCWAVSDAGTHAEHVERIRKLRQCLKDKW